MSNIEIKAAIIKDKIYIQKKDVVDKQQLIDAYTYVYGQDIFYTIEESENEFAVPSNSRYKLQIKHLIDERPKLPITHELEFKGELRNEQQEVVDRFLELRTTRSGIIQAPCGWGKTFVGCSIIAEAKVTTLILVHTKLLWKQWQEEIKKQLGITPGMIGDGLLIVGNITVGIYKTVHNNLNHLRNSFEMIIVDEVHLCPADVFSTTLNNLNARTKIGISATPRRKDGKHIVLPDYFTPFKVIARDEETEKVVPKVEIYRTDIPFMSVNPKRDWAQQLTILANNEDYHNIIAQIAKQKILNNRIPLILSPDRLALIQGLKELITNSVLLVGATKEADRQKILNSIGTTYKALLSTKLFDEGVSCHRLDTLFLTMPSGNFIKLEQRIGRIIRNHPLKQNPLIVDFWLRGPIVSSQQRKRYAWYLSQGYDIEEKIL